MFWKNFKFVLDCQGLSQKELADKANINIGTLRNQLTRNITPDLESAYRIAKVLNIPLEYLLTDKNNESNDYSGLNDDELVVIIHYRKLKEENKKVIKYLLNELT